MRRMYSESELRQVVQKYAVEGLVGKEVSVKTIEQSEANYIKEFSITTNTDLVIENIYNRFEVVNGILYIVVNFKAINNTENAISSYNPFHAGFGDLPSWLSDALIDLEGKKVSETRTGICLITASQMFMGSEDVNYFASIGAQIANLGLNNTANANGCSLEIVGASQISIGAGKFRFFTGRIALTLIP